jgi:hypothetical protein
MRRDLNSASTELKRFSQRLEKNIAKANLQTAKVGLRQAIKQSSGHVSAKQLAKEDHPYATRHGEPQRDAGTINIQSGAFLRDWHIQDGGNARNGVAIVNYNPIAKYLAEGTRKMFARPLEQVVVSAMAKVYESNLDDAVRSAMK